VITVAGEIHESVARFGYTRLTVAGQRFGGARLRSM